MRPPGERIFRGPARQNLRRLRRENGEQHRCRRQPLLETLILPLRRRRRRPSRFGTPAIAPGRILRPRGAPDRSATLIHAAARAFRIRGQPLAPQVRRARYRDAPLHRQPGNGLHQEAHDQDGSDERSHGSVGWRRYLRRCFNRALSAGTPHESTATTDAGPLRFEGSSYARVGNSWSAFPPPAVPLPMPDTACRFALASLDPPRSQPPPPCQAATANLAKPR